MVSKTALKVLEQVGKGNKKVPVIANALGISASQVYRIAKQLSKEEILTLSKSSLHPEMKTHVSLLLQLLADHPNLAKPFSGSGLKVFMAIIEPKTTKEIEQETGLHKTTILKKIKEGLKISLVYPERNKYKINDKIWSKAKEFLQELKAYEDSLDTRVPVSATIYYKNDEEIVFSTKEEVDASSTAFSAFEHFGIKILTTTHYYYLPKKQLTKEEVFAHALNVTEKDKDPRNIIFVALFYLKHNPNIQHPILENIKSVLAGEKVDRYPSKEEIKSRAELYGIKIK